MMELRIISPNEDGFVREIKWNHEELKQEVAARMKEYEGLVLTDDQISSGKKELANLRKLKKALEDERKRIKEVCLEPYRKFEEQIREVTALLDTPIDLIDGQIKEYDKQKRVEKMNEIRDIYDNAVGTLRGILPFEKVLKQQYLNATVSLKSIKKEITELIARVNNDLDTVEGLGSKFDSQIRDVYIRTLDLSLALQEKNRLEEQERQLEARRTAKMEQEEAARRAAEEEARKKVDPAAIQETAEPCAVSAREAAEPGAKAPVYVVGLEVYGDRGQPDAFCRFLKENEIFYRVTAKPRRIEEDI